MGLFSSRRSSSSTTNNVHNEKKNFQLKDNAFAIDGSNNTVNNLAPEVVEDAFSFGSETVDRAFDFGDTALGLGARAISEAGDAAANSLAFAQGTIAQSSAQNASALKTLGDQVSAQTLGDAQGRKQMIMVVASLGAVALVVIGVAVSVNKGGGK